MQQVISKLYFMTKFHQNLKASHTRGSGLYLYYCHQLKLQDDSKLLHTLLQPFYNSLVYFLLDNSLQPKRRKESHIDDLVLNFIHSSCNLPQISFSDNTFVITLHYRLTNKCVQYLFGLKPLLNVTTFIINNITGNQDLPKYRTNAINFQ